MLVLSMTLSVTFTTLLVVIAILMRVRNMSREIDNIKSHIILLSAEIEIQTVQDRHVRSLEAEINRLKPLEQLMLKNLIKRMREGDIDRPAELDSLSELQRKLYDKLPERFTTAKAIETSNALGISEPTMSRLLKKRMLFKKTSHGNYEKVGHNDTPH